jgi:hypothetical protein
MSKLDRSTISLIAILLRRMSVQKTENVIHASPIGDAVLSHGLAKQVDHLVATQIDPVDQLRKHSHVREQPRSRQSYRL